MAEEGAFWNNWKNSALPSSGSTISNAQGGYAGYKGGQSSTVATDPFAVALLNASPTEIKQIADLLVSARYLSKTTSKYNKTLADAYSRANSEFAVEASRTGRPALTLREFLI